MKWAGDEMRAAIHEDDALAGVLVAPLLGLLLELPLDLAHQRRLADAPDAHDREVAVRALQDAPDLELAAEEARPGDRLAGLVRRQQRQVELRAQAIQQLARGTPRLAHGRLRGLIEHQHAQQRALELRPQLLARPLHQDDRVALGQAARPQDVRQALGQLARGQRGQRPRP